jgi:transcriptional regulator with XRE-family HTH domain
MKNERLLALGRQIRQLREQKGLSQEAFAAEAGLVRGYYGGVERGERNIAARNLIKIAITLKIEVGQLFPELAALRRLGGNSK